MIRIQVQQYGDKPKEMLNKLDRVWFELQYDIYELANSTRDYMVNYIMSNLKRPGSTNNLINNIKVDVLDTTAKIDIGIGNINILNTNVPYWRVINYGSAHIIGLRVPQGGFYPGVSKPSKDQFRTGRWIVGSDKYSFISNNPIPPLNYIENSNNFSLSQLEMLLNKLEKDLS